MLAVFTGTGFYNLGKKAEVKRMETKYGIANLYVVTLAGEKVVFLPRHGEGHIIPPHRINYRANISALKELDVTGVLAIYSATIISKFKPGEPVLIDDFMNFSGIPMTFFDDFSIGIKHTTFERLGSDAMYKRVQEIAKAEEIKLNTGGIIATSPGPRAQTPSEIAVMKNQGANLVNMTAGYELPLLQESEIDFAAIAVGTHYGAGIGKELIKHKNVMAVMTKAKPKLETLISGFVAEMV